jgi:hypothetical protein
MAFDAGTLQAGIDVKLEGLINGVRQMFAEFQKVDNQVQKLNSSIQTQTKQMADGLDRVRIATNNVEDRMRKMQASMTTNFRMLEKSITDVSTLQTQILGNSLKNIELQLGKNATRIRENSNALNTHIRFWDTWRGKITSATMALWMLQYNLDMIAKGLAGFFGPGIQFLASIEQTTLGMAGILTSMTNIDGKATTYKQALEISATMMAKIKDAALVTSLTTEEMAKAFTTALGPGIKAFGGDLEKILNFTVVTVNAVKAMGLPAQQVAQEIRSLIAGDPVRPGVDYLATVLGYTTKTLAALKEEGKLYDDLMKRMNGFQIAAIDYANTLDGLLSNLKDGIQRVTGDAFLPLFNQLKTELKEVTKMFYDIKEVANDNGEGTHLEATLNSATVEKLTRVAELSIGIWNSLKVVMADLAPIARALGIVIEALAQTLIVILNIIGIALAPFAELANKFLDAMNSSNSLADAITFALVPALLMTFAAAHPIIATIMAIGFVLGELVKNAEEIANAWAAFWDYLKNKADATAAGIKAIVYSIKADLLSLVGASDAAKAAQMEAAQMVEEGREAWDNAEAAWGKMEDSIKKIGNNIIGDLTKGLAHIKGMAEQIKQLPKGITNKFDDKEDKGAGKLANAELQGELKERVALIKQTIEELKLLYQDGAISKTEYYERLEYYSRLILTTEAAMYREMAKNAKDAAAAEKFLADAQKKEIEAVTVGIKIRREALKDYMEFAKTLQKINIEYDKMKGINTAESVIAEFNQKHGKDFRDIILMIDAIKRKMTAENEAQLKPMLEYYEKMRDKIIEIGQQEMHNKLVVESYNELLRIRNQLLDFYISENQNKVNMGLQTQYEAEQKNYEARKKWADETRKAIADEIALGKVDRERALTLLKQLEDVKKAEAEIKPIVQFWYDSLTSSANTFFDNLTNRTMKLKQALIQFAADIAKTWAKRLFNEGLQKLLGPTILGGGKQPGEDPQGKVLQGIAKEEADKLKETITGAGKDISGFAKALQTLSTTGLTTFDTSLAQFAIKMQTESELTATALQALASAAYAASQSLGGSRGLLGGLLRGGGGGGAKGAAGGFESALPPLPRASRGGFMIGKGTSTSDSNLVRLSDGEFVIKAASVKKFGRKLFEALNAGHLPGRGYADGGMVTATSNSSYSTDTTFLNVTYAPTVQGSNNSDETIRMLDKHYTMFEQKLLRSLKKNPVVRNEFKKVTQ